MNDISKSTHTPNILNIFFTSIGTVLIILSVFVVCVEVFAFNRNYYKEEYAKLGTAAYVGANSEDLTNATEILLEYLECGRDNIDYQYYNGSQIEEYYTAREKAHMIDVAKLNINAVTFSKVGFPVSAGLLLAAYFIFKKRRAFYKTIFITTLATIGFFAFIGIWAALDFDVFWVNFHRLFFDNELWILDPKNSLMIRMFSSQFFFDMVTQILIAFLSVIVIILIVSGLLTRKYGKIAVK